MSFLDTLTQTYRRSIAHCFLLHGVGVDDCIAPGVMLSAYLRQVLTAASFDVVAFYNVATGFSFPDEQAARIAQERAQGGERAEYVPMARKAAQAAGLIADTSTMPGSRLSRAAAETIEFPRDPQLALPVIDRLLRSKLKVCMVFEFADVTFPRTATGPQPDLDTRSIFAQLWAREPQWIGGSSAPLILYVARDKEAVHSALTNEGSRVFAIDLPDPDHDERLKFIREALSVYKDVALDEGFTPDLLTTHTAGLSRLGIEDIIVSCRLIGQPVSQEAVRIRKAELMTSAYGGVLQTDPPRFGFERVAGHSEVKDYLRRNVIEPLRSGNVRRVPRGIIFTGPPGTGKSLIAEALAKEVSVNFARLNIASLMGSYVGQSERNLRRALDAIRSLTPVIVFIDELDQAFTSRDSADPNQVNKNLFGQILTFLSDKAITGKVLAIAATNRPDRIDPALRRPGRFDKMIPLLPPDAQARLDLFEIAAQGLQVKWADDLDFNLALDDSDGWTQAELEALVQAAFQQADDAGHGDVLTQEDLSEAMAYYQPSTGAVEEWSSLAVTMCNDLRLLPESWRQLKTEKNLPPLPQWAEPGTRGERAW